VLRADGTASNLGSLANGFGEGVSLAYDAATGGYTVRDASGASATFLPASRSPQYSDDKVTTYIRSSGSVEDQLTLFNPGNNNPTLKLSYVSYGAWQHSTDNGGTIDFAQQFFVYGIRQGANQPSTGSASYTIAVDGIWNNPDGIYLLSGSSSDTFTANFTNMTVATKLQLAGTNVTAPGGGTKSLGLFNGSGTIAALGGGFSGALTHSGTDTNGNVFTGTFAGAFFGPQGQEVGYTFRLTSPNGGTAAGAVVGKAN
jgi:hypothetical protein